MQQLELREESAIEELFEAAHRLERAKYAARTRPPIYSAFAAVTFFLVGLLPFMVDRLTPAVTGIVAAVSKVEWPDLVVGMVTALTASWVVTIVTTKAAEEALGAMRAIYAREAQFYLSWLRQQDDQVVVELARAHRTSDPVGELVDLEAQSRGIIVYDQAAQPRAHATSDG